MAVLTPIPIYRGQPASGGTTCFTVSATVGRYAIIKSIVVFNADTVVRNIKLHNVPSGDSAAAANRFVDYNLDPGETLTLDVAMVLAESDSLRATASASSAVTLIVSGVRNY